VPAYKKGTSGRVDLKFIFFNKSKGIIINPANMEEIKKTLINALNPSQEPKNVKKVMSPCPAFFVIKTTRKEQKRATIPPSRHSTKELKENKKRDTRGNIKAKGTVNAS